MADPTQVKVLAQEKYKGRIIMVREVRSVDGYDNDTVYGAVHIDGAFAFMLYPTNGYNTFTQRDINLAIRRARYEIDDRLTA